MNISDQELEIFARHLILKEFNNDALKNLINCKLVMVGMGGIGCPATQYLVSAGIKNIKLIDSDVVEKNNLNRQTLYSFKDIGKYKSDIAKKKLLGINPECKIESINDYLNSTNIDKNFSNASLIIDSTDNWKSMKLINKYCVDKSIPLISASAVGFDSQITFFRNLPNKHLCLQCIFPNNIEPDLSRCDTVGVMGTATGLTGIIVAQKTINYLLDEKIEDNLMLMVNTKSLIITKIKIKKNKNCKCLEKNC